MSIPTDCKFRRLNVKSVGEISSWREVAASELLADIARKLVAIQKQQIAWDEGGRETT